MALYCIVQFNCTFKGAYLSARLLWMLWLLVFLQRLFTLPTFGQIDVWSRERISIHRGAASNKVKPNHTVVKMYEWLWLSCPLLEYLLRQNKSIIKGLSVFSYKCVLVLSAARTRLFRLINIQTGLFAPPSPSSPPTPPWFTIYA